MKGRWAIGLGILLIIVLLVVPLGANLFLSNLVKVPKAEEVEVVWTDQNWSQDDWEWWYHISQGSSFEAIIPYKWFISLEQPKITFFKPAGNLIDPKFLGGFGFLPDYQNKYNPDALPVGFAKSENYFDPENESEKPKTVIGFTCAACHTGQVNYQGKGIRTEGGPAMVELNKFKTAVGLSLFLTKLIPWRFERFADRVLGQDHTTEQNKQLKQELDNLIAQAQKTRAEVNASPTVQEGFGRLDALTRIGNFVFGTEVNAKNIQPTNAPVSYPHIWSAPWFDWVQYNGSVMQPMVRNAGEAMGVFARANLKYDSENVFKSNVDVKHLHELEELLTGDSIFTGLSAPKWPEDILGTIDQQKAAKGKVLYQQYCQSCHLPPMDSAEFMDKQYWTKLGDHDREYLQVTLKNLYTIGTDPTAAIDWYQRTVDLGPLAQKYATPNPSEPYEKDGIVTAGFALPFVVEKTVEKKYDELQLTPEEREAYNGYRPNKARAPLGYKARPLNGIWATAPFLHNGSVPNLYEMFIPADERTKKFYVGTKEFDPQYVGYKPDKIPGASELDTTQKGNWNTGHEFKENGTGEGVIGPALSEEQRWAIVEYLKTL